MSERTRICAQNIRRRIANGWRGALFRIADHGSSLLDDVLRRVTLRSIARGDDPRDAAALGKLVAADLRTDWGGDRPYIDKGYKERLAERDAQIRADFTGRNVRDLMKRYRLSRVRIYEIVRPVRKR
jgi:Mor family transcriptional regulator